MTIDYSVTLRTLSLGNADTITGWHAKAFATSTIKMIKLPKGAGFTAGSIGYHSRYTLTGWTQDPVAEGDEIIDLTSKYYELKTVEPVSNGDDFICYECELSHVLPHADRPATYGADLVAAYQDPRSLTKQWLDTYITDANITEDDNATPVHNLVQWANPDYPMKYIFTTKGIEVVFSVATPSTQALPVGAGYIENMPITVYTMNTATATGTKLRWKAERELRSVTESFPLGSLRSLDVLSDNEVNLGSLILQSVTYNLRYKRYA